MEKSIKIFFIGILWHHFLIPSYGIEQINDAHSTVDAEINVSIKDKMPELKQYIQEARKLWKAPGVSVAIIEKGKIYYINDGVTKIGTDNPVTENSVFCVMSCTKIITVILLHQLEEEGLINLNDPVTKYLPDFKLSDPEATQKVQIRHLISHCIGLPSFAGDTLWHLGFSKEEIIRKLALIPLKHQPGEKYGYQNICFGIAGMLIEKVLNQPFSKIVQQRIFQKLDMNNSSVGPQNTTLWNRLLQKLKQFLNLSSPSSTNSKKPISGHKKLNGQIAPIHTNDYPYLFTATAGINSTTSDYIKLISCLNNKGIIQFGPHKGERLFSEKTWKSISTPNMRVRNYRNDTQFPIERVINNDLHYGKGMYKMRYGSNARNIAIYYHMGSGTGWRACWWIIPSAQIGIVIFSNLGSLSTSFLPEVLAYKISDLYLDLKKYDPQAIEYDWNQERYKLKTLLKDTEQLIYPAPVSLAFLSGTYHSDFYGDLKISFSESENKLYLTYKNKTASLSHISNGSFSLKPPELSSKYSDDDDDQLYFEGSTNNLTCRSLRVFRDDAFKKVK